jgi:organic radical activating enzyme
MEANMRLRQWIKIHVKRVLEVLHGGDITIGFLVFWVGTKCSMRCKDCCNLIPYLEQESFNAETIIDDLKRVAQFCRIKHLQIQGGEPLTHPHLDYIIKSICGIRNIEKITLATNGTLFFDDKLLSVLKDNPKVEIRISNYRHLEKKRVQVMQHLSASGITYQSYDFIYGSGEWFNSGGPDEIKNQNNREVQNLYDSCENKVCWTLVDGCLNICGKIYALKKLHDDYITGQNDEVHVRKFMTGGGG